MSEPQPQKPTSHEPAGTEATPAADGIEDFPNLYPRQVAFGQYRVLNIKDDGSPTHYHVDIRTGECSCPDMEFNEDDHEACKHLATALFHASGSLSVEELTVKDLATAVNEANTAARDLRQAGAGTAPASTESATSASDDDEGENDDDGMVSEVEGPEDVLSDVREWFEKASDFANFDPSIIDLSWAEVEGTKGISVERQPFAGGYYDDGEWKDKDGFDEHRDNAGELLSGRDEFQWYGEPDYVYFVAQEDIGGLVE